MSESCSESCVYNYVGSEILPYLQTNNLAWHSVMDTDRRHETPWLETEDIITRGTVDIMVACFHRVMQRGLNDVCACSGMCYRGRPQA